MNKQQIQALIDAKIAGQGSAVDVGGALPTILHEILEAAFAGENVQSNWDETDSESPQFIQNKPTIPAAQVNADWNESDEESPAYIKNKPVVAKAPLHVVVTLIPRAVENPDEPGETINVLDEAASNAVETTGQPVEYGDVVIVDCVVSPDWGIGEITICGNDPVDFGAAEGPYRLEVNHRVFYDTGDGGIVGSFGIANGAAALSPLFIGAKVERDGGIYSTRFFIDGSLDLLEE